MKDITEDMMERSGSFEIERDGKIIELTLEEATRIYNQMDGFSLFAIVHHDLEEYVFGDNCDPKERAVKGERFRLEYGIDFDELVDSEEGCRMITNIMDTYRDEFANKPEISQKAAFDRLISDELHALKEKSNRRRFPDIIELKQSEAIRNFCILGSEVSLIQDTDNRPLYRFPLAPYFDADEIFGVNAKSHGDYVLATVYWYPEDEEYGLMATYCTPTSSKVYSVYLTDDQKEILAGAFPYICWRATGETNQELWAEEKQKKEESEEESGESVIYTHDEAAAIIEIFEDFLDERNLMIASPEDGEKDPENEARLYGSVYSDLLDTTEELLIDMLERHIVIRTVEESGIDIRKVSVSFPKAIYAPQEAHRIISAFGDIIYKYHGENQNGQAEEKMNTVYGQGFNRLMDRITNQLYDLLLRCEPDTKIVKNVFSGKF